MRRTDELNFITIDGICISSAGLRVMILVKKTIGSEGTLKLRNVSPDIQDVLEITGFSSLLDK